jgi:hypothetical protein
VVNPHGHEDCSQYVVALRRRDLRESQFMFVPYGFRIRKHAAGTGTAVLPDVQITPVTQAGLTTNGFCTYQTELASAAPPSFRYFRLQIAHLQDDTKSAFITEIVYKQNGTSIISGAGSATNQPFPQSDPTIWANNAFNGVTSGGVAAGSSFDSSGAPDYTGMSIVYDMGAGNSANPDSITLNNADYVAYSKTLGSCPKEFYVEGSNDGLQWTTLLYVPNETWTGVQTKTYTLAAPVSAPVARYWRLYVEATNNGTVSITEVQIASTIGGADLTSPSTPAIASLENSSGSFPATASVDNNTTTFWNTFGGVPPQWIYYDLGTPKAVAEFRLMQRNDGSSIDQEYPTRFIIQSSPDATTWTNVRLCTFRDGSTGSPNNTPPAPGTYASYSLWRPSTASLTTTCTTTKTLLATPSGGTPAFTYAWSFISNLDGMTIASGGSTSQATFSSTQSDTVWDPWTTGVPSTVPHTAIVACTVTDSQGATRTGSYALSMSHTDVTFELDGFPTERLPISAAQSSALPGPQVVSYGPQIQLAELQFKVGSNIQFQWNVNTGAYTVLGGDGWFWKYNTIMNTLTPTQLATGTWTVTPVVTHTSGRPGGGGFTTYTDHQPTVAAPYYQMKVQDDAGGYITLTYALFAQQVGVYGLLDNDIATGVLVYGAAGLPASTNGWISYDLGAEVAVGHVALGAGPVVYNGTSYGDQTSTLTGGTTKVQYSHDNIAWSDSFTVPTTDTIQPVVHREVYKLGSVTTARYWRVINSAGPIGLTTFRLYA